VGGAAPAEAVGSRAAAADDDFACVHYFIVDRRNGKIVGLAAGGLQKAGGNNSNSFSNL